MKRTVQSTLVQRSSSLPSVEQGQTGPDTATNKRLTIEVAHRQVQFINRSITGNGIIYGEMDSFMGRNILNCSSCYKISLDNILNLHCQPSDIYSYIRANVGSSELSIVISVR